MENHNKMKEVQATQDDSMVKEYYNKLTSLYKEDASSQERECNELCAQYTMEYTMSIFIDLINESKNSRSFRIVSIERIEDSGPKLSFSLDLTERKKELEMQDQTGTFKVNFSDGTFMYFAKWLDGSGKSRMLDSIFMAENDVWKNFLLLLNKSKRKRNKPPMGKVYKFDGNRYIVKDKLKETPVVHESVSLVREDMDMFFNNIDKFTRWNMPGTRKVMLVGPPGTGKSSLSVRIANTNQKHANVSFFDDISALAKHLNLCAKYSMPTICILEDAEGTLQRPDSSLLNFLDGIDQPMNKAGAYVIMTTNYPQKIERRILQRPGRVDQIFAFGNLKGEYVMKCAEIYLKDSFFGKDKVVKGSKKEIDGLLNELFDAHGKGISGTRIKQFSEDILKYVVSKKKDKITLDEVRSIFNSTNDNLKNVYEMAMDQGLLDGDVGFDWGEKKSDESSHMFKEEDLA